MDDATLIISEITRCSAAQAKAVVAALTEAGWSPPTRQTASAPTMPITVAPASLADVPAGSVIVAHTDGACSGNPGPGGWSVVFSLGGAVVREFSGVEPATTNNRMELTAAREAIRHAPMCASLEIVTDSKNVIGWLSQGWKRNEPILAGLCREFDELQAVRVAAKGGAVSFKYVRGHNGDALNERADELATGAIEKWKLG